MADDRLDARHLRTVVVGVVAATYLLLTVVMVYYLVWEPSGEFHEREQSDPWNE